ncbi:hypothetical protein P831_04025 [Klebsiella aerogenes UCI 28]|nr:hypothetical protein P848_02334 [Klebsiella aerogenes UCI 45]EUL75449.1 hypothetical protein P831_04025 [Klebsiella aerogenes UCI 28]EUL85796.1 hypothetical protein P830_01999 [Klebsiella aerogenes UCI 27]MCP1405931.1 hypothetical protein [Klebsiella aerogenes]VAE44935.1 Uncharacterised protein [Klebsiella aerogenes]
MQRVIDTIGVDLPFFSPYARLLRPHYLAL